MFHYSDFSTAKKEYKRCSVCVQVLFVVVPGVTIGASMSKYGAAFLEEYDIFVPSDDDDD